MLDALLVESVRNGSRFGMAEFKGREQLGEYYIYIFILGQLGGKV